MPDFPRSFTVSREEQLTALLDVRHGTHLLAQFLTPRTASEAAHALAEPANRVAYHVRRLVGLGLLTQAGTRGKRRLYRVVAEDFHLSAELRRGLDGGRGAQPLLDALASGYLAAARRTPPNVSDQPFVRLRADRLIEPEPEVAFAPQLRVKIIRLTAQRFRDVSARLWQEVDELEQSTMQEVGARLCTLAILTFPGSALPLSEQSRQDFNLSLKEA